MKTDNSTDFFDLIQLATTFNDHMLDSLSDYLHNNISIIQLKILIQISDNQPLSVTALSQLVNMNYGNTSTQCTILENRNYIRRRRDSDDARVVSLYLDTRGQETINSIDYFKEVFYKTLENRYSKTDWSKVKNKLAPINQMLTESIDVIKPKEEG